MKSPENSQPFQNPEQSRQHQPAQGEQVKPSAGQEGRRYVEPGFPVFPEEGHPEQQHHHAQPEQNVQRKGQPPPPGAAAQGPQHVVDQAQTSAQQQTQQKDLPLDRHVHTHGQRSKRARNPPCVPRSSS